MSYLHPARRTGPPLWLEPLEARDLPAVTVSLAAGLLSVVGDAARDTIVVALDRGGADLVVYNQAVEAARFPSASVSLLQIDGGGGRDRIRVDRAVPQPAQVVGGDGDDVLRAGGGPAALLGGAGDDKLVSGPAADLLDGDGGANRLLRVQPTDVVVPQPGDRVQLAVIPVVPPPAGAAAGTTLTTDEVELLLRRAAAASASDDALIAVVDRNGRLLGLRAEAGVAPEVTGSAAALTFAVDGALAKARTGAFFANNQAPLTSRTVQFISQTTMTQREVESNPSLGDINSTLYGPGFVAPIGIKGHFPPNVPFTPQVDLFAIEHTNRDSILHPGPDGIKNTGDEVLLPSRFNVSPAFIPPGQELFPPESYGLLAGIFPQAQARGIATLPGGVPIFKGGALVGGIGVFFPGRTGFATEENSSLDAKFDPARRDRSFEAEFIAFAAAGGSSGAAFPVGAINGAPALPQGFDLPFGRIDLVGITLDVFGPGGNKGPQNLVRFGSTLGPGDPDSGGNLPVDTAGNLFLAGLPVPEGFLVTPHDGVDITAAEVERIIRQGVAEAERVRAAIRLPLGERTRMVFAVADRTGEVLGLFRMADATVFSLDVAVAKARNVAYYADVAQLQPADQVPGVPPGAALTNRTFRFLALPRFPEGIDGAPPGPFSVLNDGGVDPTTGLNVGPPLPGSAYTSVQGFDAFRPGTNFRDPTDPLNRNGVVFFPGSAPLYANGALIGGFGVSGDGVDQDDVVTAAGAAGFEPPAGLRVDQFFVGDVRLPYQKFNRNPRG